MISALLDTAGHRKVTLTAPFQAGFRSKSLRRAILHPAVAVLAAWVILVAGAALPVLADDNPPNSDTKAYSLSADHTNGQLAHVKVAIEIKGKLKVGSPGKTPTDLPLEVRADLSYDERILDAGDTPGAGGTKRRSIRQYDEAQASIVVGKSNIASRLAPDRRLIVAQAAPEGQLLFSPIEPLTREELELLDVPASSLLLTALLPESAVKPGDTWKPDARWLAPILGWDSVSQTDITCRFDRVEENVAYMEMGGTASGAAEGVASDIELKTKYSFDIGDKRINWFVLAMKERRSIGHAEPGFDVVCRIRLESARIDDSPSLGDDALVDLPLVSPPGITMLRLQPAAGGVHLLCDRRWRVTEDSDELAVLRLVDKGDILAQCNLSPLTPLAPGKQLSLEELQSDVQRALGKNFGEFIEASQATTESGLRVLRTVSISNVENIPIQWIHYHVSDDKGHRVGLAFTLEASRVERFAEADQALVQSIELVPSPPVKTTITDSNKGGTEVKSNASDSASRTTPRTQAR